MSADATASQRIHWAEAAMGEDDSVIASLNPESRGCLGATVYLLTFVFSRVRDTRSRHDGRW